MSEYVYQEYPKVKYHPKHEPRTVQNIEEEKALGRGWVNSPNEFPKPSRIAGALRNDVKPWWDEWDWSFKATTTLLGIIVILATIITAVYRMMR
jgi:hypothetical protein